MRALCIFVLGLVIALATTSAQAAFPGDNGLLVYVTTDSSIGRTGTIATVRPDGTRRRMIGRGSDPSWAPDGDRLVFVTRRAGVTGLVTTNALGRDLRRLLCAACAGPDGSPLTTDYADPEWSPDGDVLAVATSTGGLAIVDIGTGLDAEDDFDPSRPLAEDCGAGCLSAAYPAWSPNGRRVAFAMGSSPIEYSESRICIVAATARIELTELGGCVTDDSGPSLGGDYHPDWSPDGRLLAFTRLYACTAAACRSGIYVVRPDGTGLRRIVADAEMPAWSPDGTRLSFVKVGRVGSCGEPICRLGIWTVRANGRDARRVTRGTRDAFPDWQPR